MKILGIDSSGLVASAAIADEKNIIAEFTVNNKQTHSQTLLPMIEKVVDMSGIELEQIDAIAIAARFIYGTPYRFSNGKGDRTCS